VLPVLFTIELYHQGCVHTQASCTGHTNWNASNFMMTSVACAVGSSVNTLRAQLNFPSKPKFCNLFGFPGIKSIKNQYLPHLTSENCEINFIKSDSPRAFQQHQERPQILLQFSVSIH